MCCDWVFAVIAVVVGVAAAQRIFFVVIGAFLCFRKRCHSAPIRIVVESLYTPFMLRSIRCVYLHECVFAPLICLPQTDSEIYDIVFRCICHADTPESSIYGRAYRVYKTIPLEWPRWAQQHKPCYSHLLAIYIWKGTAAPPRDQMFPSLQPALWRKSRNATTVCARGFRARAAVALCVYEMQCAAYKTPMCVTYTYFVPGRPNNTQCLCCLCDCRGECVFGDECFCLCYALGESRSPHSAALLTN